VLSWPHLVLYALVIGTLPGTAPPKEQRRTPVHDSRLENTEPTARLYQISPFVHGYRDGYQQGFHDADVDQHFARQPLPPEKAKDYRDVMYRPEMGDRKSYVEGFRAGFVRGYHDLQAGRSLRIFELLIRARKESKVELVASPELFNAGVIEGYQKTHSGEGQIPKPVSFPESCNSRPTDPYCIGLAFGRELAKAEVTPAEPTK
jgi:hypothetical protein